MRDILIPTIINTGQELKRYHKVIILSLIIAFLLHILFIATMDFFDKNPLIFLFPHKEIRFNPEKTMQYVLVDEKLEDEKNSPEEKTTAEGRVSRVSQDEIIDKTLPKRGPTSKSKTALSAFTSGAPQPATRAAPPTRAQPERRQAPKPRQQIQPQPKKIETKVEEESTKVPDIASDFAGDLPEFSEGEAEKILKHTEKPVQESISRPTPKVPELKTTPQRPQKAIPVRKITPRSRPSGSKMATRANSSAIRAGIKSLAVLKSRYGSYMDLVIRRIQQAVYIQQQLAPIMYSKGAVIMTFAIDANGKLGKITFLDSIPKSIEREIAAARSVLNTVRDGKPFPPPSSAMLRDPDFQRITINFIFEPR